MTDTPATHRLAPRWLHAWAVLTTVATFVLLLLGQLVTSYRAGMADPVWPTEPWYVFRTATESEKQKYRDDFPFFIEHTHRIVGWTVGGMAIVLACGVLWLDPRRVAKWVGLAGVVVLVGGYGELHRGLMNQRDVPASQVTLPALPAGVVGLGLLVALGASGSGLATGVRGAGLRVIGTLALAAVMVQGLLGGARVALNALMGTDLATIHGVFAQVVVGLLVTVAVLTARRPAGERPSPALRYWLAGLAAVLFVQVIWGAMVRHQPTPIMKRLHFLTAFVATAVAVWALRQFFSEPAARSRARFAGYLLGTLLALQLYLGVEAWLQKLAAWEGWMQQLGQYRLPEEAPIVRVSAIFVTLHALVGTGLLATTVGLVVRMTAGRGVRVPGDAGGGETVGERDGGRVLAFSHARGDGR